MKQVKKNRIGIIVIVLLAFVFIFPFASGKLGGIVDSFKSNIENLNTDESDNGNSDSLTDSSIDIEANFFEGKTMACLGDSITYGYVTKQGGQYENPYPKLLKTTLGLKDCYNYGVGSSTLASGEKSYKSFLDRWEDMPDDLDIIAVMGGTNDYSRNIPLGTPDSRDENTIYGALHILASGLREKYPDAYIFFMSPTPRKDSWNNAEGYNVEDVGNAVSYIADLYEFGFLDMYRLSGFENEMKLDSTDGLHPSQYLIETSITPTIVTFLKENYK